MEEKIKEREDAIKTWAINKEASDAFQEEWRERDEQARRLLSMFEAQRDGQPVPIFDERQASPLLSELGDEDAEGEDEDLWERDFEQALAEGERERLAHNLLSPTPVNGEADAGIGEAAFKYAGMKINDGLQQQQQLGVVDSGYESGLTSGHTSSILGLAGETEESLLGWDTPEESTNTQASWKAAWDTVLPVSSEVKTEEWEYSYAQEG